MVGSKKDNHLLYVLYTILLNIQYAIICKSNSKSQIMGTPNTRYYLIHLQLISLACSFVCKQHRSPPFTKSFFHYEHLNI